MIAAMYESVAECTKTPARRSCDMLSSEFLPTRSEIQHSQASGSSRADCISSQNRRLHLTFKYNALSTWMPSEEDDSTDFARHTRPDDPAHSFHHGSATCVWDCEPA